MPRSLHAPWYAAFHDLMPYRVQEILLVSSKYDAFTLEEDGRLVDRLHAEYSELGMTSAPRITHAEAGERALELLLTRRFDLVIAMVRPGDVDLQTFASKVKALQPWLPVVLLSPSEADLDRFRKSAGVPHAIDGIFVWSGDARILLAIIKLIEDGKNVAHDTRIASVRVILVVEDSVRRYSSFLTLLYSELMTQSFSLIAEGINEQHKLMRMRARPRILLATTFEDAVDLWSKYREFTFAIISDVRFPRGGIEDRDAGVELVKVARAWDPEIPILLQSADKDTEARATELGVHYADKNSQELNRRIRSFLRESLGFGEFIFRLADRTEVARAKDVREMEQVLATVPTASVEYHASRNHFSLWLIARSMFSLAQRLKPKTIGELGGVEASREHILNVLREARTDEGGEMITDFSQAHEESLFVRLGQGSIGGKARGIAFVNALLAQASLDFTGLDIKTPRTIAIGTDAFDQFMEQNALYDELPKLDTDARTLERFLEAKLPETLVSELEVAVRDWATPIAVRSSSLLEDSQHQPFAGIYATYMLPNAHANPNVRTDELQRAIKAVYASTFSRNARAYLANTTYSIEDEKMAVVIQQIVGRQYGSRFYPTISGVALSYNYYPMGNLRAEDGLAVVALGLGQTIVRGGRALQFSPRAPDLLPQFPTPHEFLKYSQSQFVAIDMSRTTIDFQSGDESSLVHCELADAEEDGTLRVVGSTYSASDDRIRDTLSHPGPRLVTFANILRYESLPLAAAIDAILQLARRGMGGPVEIELAVDVPTGETACLYVVQIRPQASESTAALGELPAHETKDVLCETHRALGHGVVRDVRDIVWIKRVELDPQVSASAAAAVGEINGRLQQAGRPYLLIGPGRWGSSDPYLGIPVEWSQISRARIIIETAMQGRTVEPSQGSHFFHNMTTMEIGYLTVTDHDGEHIDTAWLESLPAAHESAILRHIQVDRPLVCSIDGRAGRATVLKPMDPDARAE